MPPSISELLMISLPQPHLQIQISPLYTPATLSYILCMSAKYRSLYRLDAREHYRVCSISNTATYSLLRPLLPKRPEDPALHHDLSACQDRPSLRVTRLRNMYKRAGGLVRVLREFCMVQREVWKVMADLRRNAFGTPMFSQRPDRG
jgi:hypothetical protein